MWQSHAGTTFSCEKTPVTASRGMIVTNHPLASTAAVEMLASGGNAIDATVAALFTLVTGYAYFKTGGKHLADRSVK